MLGKKVKDISATAELENNGQWSSDKDQFYVTKYNGNYG